MFTVLSVIAVILVLPVITVRVVFKVSSSVASDNGAVGDRSDTVILVLPVIAVRVVKVSSSVAGDTSVY